MMKILDAAIKLIARIRRHPIIVRDANRVHHFGIDGHCSCGDHFCHMEDTIACSFLS